MLYTWDRVQRLRLTATDTLGFDFYLFFSILLYSSLNVYTDETGGGDYSFTFYSCIDHGSSGFMCYRWANLEDATKTRFQAFSDTFFLARTVPDFSHFAITCSLNFSFSNIFTHPGAALYVITPNDFEP